MVYSKPLPIPKRLDKQPETNTVVDECMNSLFDLWEMHLTIDNEVDHGQQHTLIVETLLITPGPAVL